jgi:hypothetical protein
MPLSTTQGVDLTARVTCLHYQREIHVVVRPFGRFYRCMVVFRNVFRCAVKSEGCIALAAIYPITNGLPSTIDQKFPRPPKRLPSISHDI